MRFEDFARNGGLGIIGVRNNNICPQRKFNFKALIDSGDQQIPLRKQFNSFQKRRSCSLVFYRIDGFILSQVLFGAALVSTYNFLERVGIIKYLPLLDIIQKTFSYHRYQGSRKTNKSPKFNKANQMWKIKSNYQHRSEVEYFEDKETLRIHQPHIYEFADYLCNRSNAKYIIDIGCGNGKKIENFTSPAEKIGIDTSSNLDLFQNNNPGAKTFSVNLESEIPNLGEEIIENSVVICADVLEHLHNPEKLLEFLSQLSYKALFVLISTPDRVRLRGIGNMGPPKNPWHLREWSCDELNSLFQEYKFKPGFWGYSVNNDAFLEKTTSLYIGGKLNGFGLKGNNPLNAVAIISTYNEFDIAIQTIKHYLKQGLHVHVIDNWSDNGTFEKIEKLSTKEKNITIERFPIEGRTNQFTWEKIIDRKSEYALESGFDWAIHVDADELRFSPWPEITLLEGIKIVDALGFNAIDFTVFEFRPTKEGFSERANPKTFFHHFEFAKVPGAFLRITAWKIFPEKKYDISSKGGHHIQFEGQKVFPLKFEYHHFAYRSLQQIKEKLYVGRFPRIGEETKTKGWHFHLIDFAVNHGVKLWDVNQLLRDSNLTREIYLIERLSGIGLPRREIDIQNNKKLYQHLQNGRIKSFENLTLQLLDDSETQVNGIKQRKNTADNNNPRSWIPLKKFPHIRNVLSKVKRKIKSFLT